MVKLKLEPVKRVKLKRGNKVIERDLLDYETNKANYQIRGFSVITSESKVEKVKKIVKEVKSKVKKNVKKTKKARKKSMD